MTNLFINTLTFNNILLIILVTIIISIFITEILIYILNRINPLYKTTYLHYFLPVISVIAYIFVIIEELILKYLKPK